MITPTLAFSESSLFENLRQLNGITVDGDRRWAARLTRRVPANLLREAILPATQLAACSKVTDAEYLAEAGFQSVLLFGRVVDAESLQLLERVAKRTQVVAVIDHFRHAELLSQCVSHSTCQIEVLIDVDVGQQSTGVQPGTDAAFLSSAASQLSGLKVIGVFASAVDDCQTQTSVTKAPDYATVVRIADHARRSIQSFRSGGDIVVASSEACEPLLSDSRISCLVVSPFSRVQNGPQETRQEPAICVVATVISRPSLEWCVIDVGESALGGVRGLCVKMPSEASIRQMMPETCALQLTGESCDLRIGDTVYLTVQNPEILLQRVSVS